MISVQNHRHTILLRHRSGMISSGHCASDGSMELSVVLGRPLNGPPILDGDLAKWLAWDYLYISRSSHPDIRDPCPRPLLLEKLFAGGCGGFKQDPYEKSRHPKPTARECPSPSRHKIEIHQLKTGSWWEHPSCVLPAKQHQHQRQMAIWMTHGISINGPQCKHWWMSCWRNSPRGWHSHSPWRGSSVGCHRLTSHWRT